MADDRIAAAAAAMKEQLAAGVALAGDLQQALYGRPKVTPVPGQPIDHEGKIIVEVIHLTRDQLRAKNDLIRRLAAFLTTAQDAAVEYDMALAAAAAPAPAAG